MGGRRTGADLRTALTERAAARARVLATITSVIAAHAAETGQLLLTRDAKARFSDLPGITAIDA